MVVALFVAAATLVGPRSAAADKRSSTVAVSVRVVASCRITAKPGTDAAGLDYELRCASGARPRVTQVEGQPHRPQVADATEGTRILQIDF